MDLDYPESLHNVHNSYPLAPEHLTIEKHQLSLYSMTEKYHSFQKLVPNLFNKTNYIVNYRNLKFYLNHGLILKKIHKVLSFHQSPWMRPYINFCCEQRKLSSSNFQKDFWKLLMNSFLKYCHFLLFIIQ